ncbi:PilW family protein [Alcanivorax quisquiliarum]|uniref:PilW family protein n=1 Tax=Alcanivorax quisquiliarum TaxID=2933565 RepID=A0ABT0EA34_9GAMM|nr:PilW family protein [Alcanivorax quisquiliarum]MCK0538497.1 PilW family protein [Alcanivorax quisquiliarum]
MMQNQRGLTLIELMIAMLLSALVILAATQLFTTNQQLFMTQQIASRVMDDGQLVLRFIGSDMRQAGYSGGALPSYSGVVFGGAGGSDDGDPSDQVAVRFNGNQDCQGTVSPTSVTITNLYFVNGNGELMCDGSLSADPVALVEGVEAMRVMYGLDMAGDGEIGPIRFMDATAAQGVSRPVVAIRLAILMAEESNALPVNEERTWHVLDREITTGKDQVLRRIFTSTFMLRSMDWEQI